MANKTQLVKQIKKGLSTFNFERAETNSDNEAKTRMYLVEPFFDILGYNKGFDNGNLVPEYTADFGNLKGKKVDYAIQFRNKPEVIVEVKKAQVKLSDRHLRQLNEYFVNTNDSKLGILTNGVVFNFYCRNKNAGVGLHPTPFYSFDFSNIDGSSLEKLADFYATNIEVSDIVEEAQELFFLEDFEEALFQELLKPSKEFIRAIYVRMGGSRLTESTENQIREVLNSVSLQEALERLIVEEAKNANKGIITTSEELKAFHVVKTILAQNRKVNTHSIGYRDTKSKFSVIVDDNQRQKICDLYINDK
ncbi:MAG: type I restriction enzyme HsdR N-terminal domain-containing protein, partial [Bacteroidota bacterium]